MKVLLVDDHALVRSGIASLLKANDIQVVGEASDGFEALTVAQELQPDVILMDIKMPRCNGLEATRLIKVKMPHMKIVILTVSEEDDDLFDAVKSGAVGYLSKNIRAEEFINQLFGVVAGEAAISPLLAGKIMEEFARRNARETSPSASEEQLTAREVEILRLVAGGFINKEIASNLNVTENTVKYHLRNIMEKLHLKNRAHVVAYAISKGIVPPTFSKE